MAQVERGRPSLAVPSWFALTWHAAVWVGAALLVWSIADLVGRPAVGLEALIVLGVLALIAELRPVVIPGNDPYGVVVSDAFVLAILYIYGLAPALVAQAIVTAVAEAARRKAWWKAAFNVGQYVVSLAAVWPVMVAVGAAPDTGDPVASLTADDLPWMAVTWVLYFVVNNAFVSGLHESEGATFAEVFFEDFWYYVLTHFAVFVLSPVVALVALGGWPLLPLLLLPLFAVEKAARISREKHHAANHDPLTGLANRTLMEERIADALDERHGSGMGLLLLDLNRFKEVNDTLGHVVGDEVLRAAAGRIVHAVRPGDTVARLGGDEFAVVLPGLTDAIRAVEIAGRVRTALRQPITVDDVVLELDVAIGIVFGPEHGDESLALVRHADAAMYLAKERDSRIEVYGAGKDAAGRSSLLGALRRAIEDEELVLNYQPVVAVPGFEVVAVEALLRWQHPERGILAPSEFLPLAESAGLMHRVSRFVLDHALEQAARWRAEGIDVPVAVNVSMRDMSGLALAETCEQLLIEHGLPGSALQLEITERMLMADLSMIGRSLDALADLGVRLSLDDFGSGFASLVLLRRLPVDRLKIDAGFVRRVHVSDDDRAIVASIVDLAHALGITTVAEGVESARVWQALADLGCDAAQGWHIGRDMPVDEATHWLRVHAATLGAAGAGRATAAGETRLRLAPDPR